MGILLTKTCHTTYYCFLCVLSHKFTIKKVRFLYWNWDFPEIYQLFSTPVDTPTPASHLQSDVTVMDRKETAECLLSLTWQGSAQGGEGTELQFVHDTEAGTLLQDHQSPAGEKQGEVQTLSHDTQPQDPYKTEGGRRGDRIELCCPHNTLSLMNNPTCMKADMHVGTTGLLLLGLEIWIWSSGTEQIYKIRAAAAGLMLRMLVVHNIQGLIWLIWTDFHFIIRTFLNICLASQDVHCFTYMTKTQHVTKTTNQILQTYFTSDIMNMWLQNNHLAEVRTHSTSVEIFV